jgi:hypothetical protein
MVRKGKFKLLSFLTENHLIYYKSINKHNKLVAFSILKIKNLLKVLPLLDEFLLKNFLYYYSIQINVPKNRNIKIILTFIESDRSKIDKLFNLISQKIQDYDKSIKFLKNRNLEQQFLRILSSKINNSINSMNSNESLIIKQGISEKIFDFYEINCDAIQIENVTLHALIKALSNFNQKGFLIFNIRSPNSGSIALNAYFINIRRQKESKSLEIEKEINTLFECEVFKKSIISLNYIYSILWRTNFSDKFYNIGHDSDIFLSLSYFNFYDLSKFSIQFDKLLCLSQINYHQLRPNLFFIEEKCLFLILDFYNPIEISRILEKFFSKYSVIILILNMEEYNKLVESSEIKLLKNVKIINSKDFTKININNLKNENLLEYT